MRLWYLRRGVPWPAVTGCLAVAAVLALSARQWPSYADLLLPFAVASGAAGAGFLLDEEGAVVVGATPRGGRWADVSRLAVLPLLGLLVAALVRPAATGAELSATAWSVVSLVAVGVGAAAASLLRGRLLSPGPQVAVLLVLVTAVPFTVGGLLGWAPPWPRDALSGGRAVLWAGLAAGAFLALGASVLRAGPRAHRRSASMTT